MQALVPNFAGVSFIDSAVLKRLLWARADLAARVETALTRLS